MRIVLIALVVLLLIRYFLRSQRPKNSDPTSGAGSKVYQEGEITIQKKGSNMGATEDTDFEEVKD